MNPEKFIRNPEKIEEMGDQDMWDLLHAMEAQLEKMHVDHRAWQERDAAFQEDRANIYREIDEREKQYAEKYQNDERMATLAKAAVENMRNAQAEYEAAHQQVGRALATYNEEMQNLEESVADLHAELKKSRN